MNAFGLRNLLSELTDTHDRERSAQEIGEDIALEAILLAQAAIYGDFMDYFWPPLKFHFNEANRIQHHLREASSAGVEKRRTKSNKMAELCRSIANQCTRRKHVRGKAVFVLDTLKKQGRRRPPSLRTIQNWIR
jgi:hypothetical protein